MRKRDFAALLILLAAYYFLKGVGGLIRRGAVFMRVPMKKNDKDQKSPVECAICRKTAWVKEDELHYCPPCYRKVQRLSDRRASFNRRHG